MKIFAIVFTALVFCGCVKKAEKPAASDAGEAAPVAASDAGAVAAPAPVAADAGSVATPVEAKADKPEKAEKPAK